MFTVYTIENYNRILKIKNALGINQDTEASLLSMLDAAREHNKKEVFLLEYLIDRMKKMPREIKKRFDYMIENEKNKNFDDIYFHTELLFRTNDIFKSYSDEIHSELELDIKSSIHYLNSLIYEAAYDEIEEYSIFSADFPVMNFYLLQKWLNKFKTFKTGRLSFAEYFVISRLIEGWFESEIIASCPDKTGIIAENLMKYKIPAKFHSETIIQALAVYLYKKRDA